jgi:ankyrin repeat protein
LHFAAYTGNTKIAALLLQHGADPKAANRAKKTPRDVASDRGHAGVFQMMGG